MGLSTNGVPSNLKNTVFPFFYNDIKLLKKIVKNIKIIKMRSQEIKDQKIIF